MHKITAVHFHNSQHIKLSYSPHMTEEITQEKWSFEFVGDWIVGRWKETGERLAWPPSSIRYIQIEPLPLPELPEGGDVKVTQPLSRRIKSK